MASRGLALSMLRRRGGSGRRGCGTAPQEGVPLSSVWAPGRVIAQRGESRAKVQDEPRRSWPERLCNTSNLMGTFSSGLLPVSCGSKRSICSPGPSALLPRRCLPALLPSGRGPPRSTRRVGRPSMGTGQHDGPRSLGTPSAPSMPSRSPRNVKVPSAPVRCSSTKGHTTVSTRRACATGRSI